MHSKLAGVFLIKHVQHADDRGYFTRLFCNKEIQAITSNSAFVQSNFCHTQQAHTFRGLHYQVAPHSEAKIIKCMNGEIIDVVVDMRDDSPTYLQSLEINLKADEPMMIFVPEGFAHGYLSLQDDTKIIYFTNNHYHLEAERGLNPLDPKLNLEVKDKIKILSDKDKNAPFLS